MSQPPPPNKSLLLSPPVLFVGNSSITNLSVPFYVYCFLFIKESLPFFV